MDTISNAITKIRNANSAGLKDVSLRNYKIVRSIVEILKDNQFIEDYSVEDSEIMVNLMYNRREPVISGIERVSRPGQRIYVSHKDLKPVLRGRGTGIVSTSKGVMSIEDAKSEGIGGEYICKVW